MILSHRVSSHHRKQATLSVGCALKLEAYYGSDFTGRRLQESEKNDSRNLFCTDRKQIRREDELVQVLDENSRPFSMNLDDLPYVSRLFQ